MRKFDVKYIAPTAFVYSGEDNVFSTILFISRGVIGCPPFFNIKYWEKKSRDICAVRVVSSNESELLSAAIFSGFSAGDRPTLSIVPFQSTPTSFFKSFLFSTAV